MSDVRNENKRQFEKEQKYEMQMTIINGIIWGVVGLCGLATICLICEVRPIFADNFFIALFTIFVGGGAIVQGLFLYKQDVALRRSFEDTRKSNQRQQRAFLSIDYRRDIKTASFMSENVAYVTITNAGNTPASTILFNAATSTKESYISQKDFDKIEIDKKPKSYTIGDISFSSKLWNFIELMKLPKGDITLSKSQHIGELFPNKSVTRKIIVARDYPHATTDYLLSLFVTYDDIFGEKRYTTVTC